GGLDAGFTAQRFEYRPVARVVLQLVVAQGGGRPRPLHFPVKPLRKVTHDVGNHEPVVPFHVQHETVFYDEITSARLDVNRFAGNKQRFSHLARSLSYPDSGRNRRFGVFRTAEPALWRSSG